MSAGAGERGPWRWRRSGVGEGHVSGIPTVLDNRGRDPVVRCMGLITGELGHRRSPRPALGVRG